MFNLLFVYHGGIGDGFCTRMYARSLDRKTKINANWTNAGIYRQLLL